jgi:hypothetical protein
MGIAAKNNAMRYEFTAIRSIVRMRPVRQGKVR